MHLITGSLKMKFKIENTITFLKLEYSKLGMSDILKLKGAKPEKPKAVLT